MNVSFFSTYRFYSTINTQKTKLTTSIVVVGIIFSGFLLLGGLFLSSHSCIGYPLIGVGIVGVGFTFISFMGCVMLIRHTSKKMLMLQDESDRWLEFMPPALCRLFPEPEKIPLIYFKSHIPFIEEIGKDEYLMNSSDFKKNKCAILRGESKDMKAIAIYVAYKEQMDSLFYEWIVITFKGEEEQIRVKPEGPLHFLSSKFNEANEAWLNRLIRGETCRAILTDNEQNEPIVTLSPFPFFNLFQFQEKHAE